MFFDFLRKEKLPVNFALIDLTDTGANAVIFDVSGDPGSRLTILGAGQEDYPSGVVSSGVITNFDSFLTTLRNSLRKASSGGGFNPGSVIFGLSREFIKAVSAKVKLKRKDPLSPVTKEEWSFFSKKIDEILLLSAAAEMVNVSGNAEELKLTEKRLISIAADERKVETIFGEKAAELDLEYFLSFSTRETIELLRQTARALGKVTLLRTAKVLNIIRALAVSRGIINSLLVDLGRDSTDVAVVLGGSLIGVRTIPFGASAAELGGAGLDDWLSMLEMALADFEGVRAFPRQIIVYGGMGESEVLREGLRAFPWSKKFPFSASPEISSLGDLADLSSFKDESGRMTEFIPSVLSALSFFDYAQDRHWFPESS